MFKEYFTGDYKNFRTDITPLIQLFGIHGEGIIGLELGISRSDSFMTILENCPNISKLYGVDSYKPHFDILERRSVEDFELEMIRSESLLKHKYSKHKDKIVFIEKDSVEASLDIENESLDFIFIDADHSYEAVKKDLETWYPKVKKGGLFSGHDYEWPEVRVALEEFRNENNINTLMNVYMSCYVWRK